MSATVQDKNDVTKNRCILLLIDYQIFPTQNLEMNENKKDKYDLYKHKYELSQVASHIEK